MNASMCVLMHFRCVLGQKFSRLWAALEQVALAYCHRMSARACGIIYREKEKTIDTVSEIRIVMYTTSKRFIHTLPTEMFF